MTKEEKAKTWVDEVFDGFEQEFPGHSLSEAQMQKVRALVESAEMGTQELTDLELKDIKRAVLDPESSSETILPQETAPEDASDEG